MICKNCGNEIQDNAAFCPHCGATAGGVSQSAYTGPEAPVPGKSKKGLLIGAAVAAVAVIAVLVVVVSGLFSNAKGQVEKAMTKTVSSFREAGEKLGLPDTAQWQRSRTVHQDASLTLKSINSQLVGYDRSSLSGLELYLNTDYNGPDWQMYFDLGGRWGDGQTSYPAPEPCPSQTFSSEYSLPYASANSFPQNRPRY